MPEDNEHHGYATHGIYILQSRCFCLLHAAKVWHYHVTDKQKIVLLRGGNEKSLGAVP